MKSSRGLLIVGAGFSGAVLARALVQNLDVDIHVIDQRNHVAGNCHTERDRETGVMVHCYGPHIFNTNRADVWKFVQQFGEMVPFVNRVKAVVEKGVFSLPINLHTINQFFDRKMSPTEAENFIRSRADKAIADPQNFEEQALRMMGPELYHTFFYGYTRKQWGCEPRELPASILKRLPMRFNYDDNYYQSMYQGIPRDGYTAIIEKLLAHPRITVTLDKRFIRSDATAYGHTFFTGPIDEYFDYCHGRLGYRTVTFKRFSGRGDHLGNAVLNYPDMSTPYTRVHEHKHFAPWESHEDTVWFEEYSKETEKADVPFYPKRLTSDLALLKTYGAMTETEASTSFLGRLGTYRYINMDQAIGEALDFAFAVCKARRTGESIPKLPSGIVL